MDRNPGYRQKNEEPWLFILHPRPVCLLFTPFRTHACHTYSLTTSGPALPVMLTIQPQKNLSFPALLRDPLSSKSKLLVPLLTSHFD